MYISTLLSLVGRIALLFLWKVNVSPASARKFTINNNCNVTIWPAVAQNGFGASYTDATGWEAPAKSSKSVTVPDGFSGRFWARQECDTSGNCATGGCPGGISCTGAGTPPVTLVEFTLAGGSAPSDFYDISIIDGFNLPVELKTSSACPSFSCSTDFDPWCPSELIAAKSSSGATLACKNSEQFFDFYSKGCPHVYVRPTDDGNALFSNTCPGSNGADYTLTFCPIGTVVAGDDSATTTSTSTTSSSTSSSSLSSQTATSTSSSQNTTSTLAGATGTPNSQGTMTSLSSESSAATTSTGASNTGDRSADTVNSSNSPSGGAIAGIAVGAIVVLALLAAAIFFCLRRRRQKQQEKLHDEALYTQQFAPIEPFVTTYGGPTTNPEMSPTSSGRPSAGVIMGGKRVPERSQSGSGSAERLINEKAPQRAPSSSAASSSVRSRQTTSPAHSGPEAEQVPQPMNIQQLFEDRRFENELLNFLSTRMDPPTQARQRRMGGDEEPPEYRDQY